MKKILIIDGIYPINTRNQRIVNTLEKENIVEVCSWNRENSEIIEKYKYIYNDNSGYGKKIKKLLGMNSYRKFIKKVIEDYKPQIILASQWDMLALVILNNFKGKIIYENLDLPTSSNKYILKLLLIFEKILLKNIDGIIFASRFFPPLYSKYKIKKILIENLPLKKIDFSMDKINIENRLKIRISFIGGLRYFDTMKNLLVAIKDNPNIELFLIGKGPDNKKFKNFIQKMNIKNVFILGKYNYEEIKKFYLNTDLIWAVYPSDDYNVKYAISNKFFESMLFEKPCFFAEDTLLGEYIKKYKIGFTIDPFNLEKMEFILKELTLEKIYTHIKNIKNYKIVNKLYWEENENDLLNFIKDVGND